MPAIMQRHAGGKAGTALSILSRALDLDEQKVS